MPPSLEPSKRLRPAAVSSLCRRMWNDFLTDYADKNIPKAAAVVIERVIPLFFYTDSRGRSVDAVKTAWQDGVEVIRRVQPIAGTFLIALINSLFCQLAGMLLTIPGCT